MKKFIFYLTLIISFSLFVNSAGTDEEFIIKLAGKSSRYNQNYATERVYVHLDKQYYQPGEDIWFKAYVSSALYEDLSAISNDLHIKVFDVFGNEIIWKRYPVSGNTASGILVIPKSAATGKYIMAAFTGWMKNMEIADVFHTGIIISKNVNKQLLADLRFPGKFHKSGEEIKADLRIQTTDSLPATNARYSYTVKSIDEVIAKGKGKADNEGKAAIEFSMPELNDGRLVTIDIDVKYSGKHGRVVKLVPGINKEVDLQFYPEGGNIVAGVTGRIAFKAVDSYGFPFAFEGNVYDENDDSVLHVKSDDKGMGVFKITPESQQYKARITIPEGIDQEFRLPEVNDNGLVLCYTGIRNNSIILYAESGNPDETMETYWIGRMNNNILWATIIKFRGSRAVEIPLVNFTPGIVQVNVFNKDKSHLAERLIYVDDINQTGVQVRTDKQVYGSREKVTVWLSAGDGYSDTTTADISISVTNKNLLNKPNNLHSFLNSHLMNCRLQDLIPELVSGIDYKNSQDDIDLIMMTSKLKGITYTDLLKDEIVVKPPYYNQDGLSGVIIDKKGNPVNNATINFIHAPNKQIYETATNEKGIFKILFGDDIIDFNFLTLTVPDEIAGQVNEILVNSLFSDQVPGYFAVIRDNWNIQKVKDLLAYPDPDMLYSGKYRIIKKDRVVIEQKKKYDKLHYSTYTNVMDIIKELKTYTIINNQIVFQGGINSINNQQGALIVIDGVKVGTDIGVLETLVPSDIENINISTNVVDIHSYTGLNSQGIIEITTTTGPDYMEGSNIRKGNYIDVAEEDIEFYSPDYEVESGIKEDLRTTLYWNHDLSLSPDKETVVSFYTSDIKGKYAGRVEGIRDDGIPVNAEFEFTVE